MDFLGGEQSFVMPKPSLPVLIILALGVLTVRFGLLQLFSAWSVNTLALPCSRTREQYPLQSMFSATG